MAIQRCKCGTEAHVRSAYDDGLRRYATHNAPNGTRCQYSVTVIPDARVDILSTRYVCRNCWHVHSVREIGSNDGGCPTCDAQSFRKAVEEEQERGFVVCLTSPVFWHCVSCSANGEALDTRKANSDASWHVSNCEHTEEG